MEALLVTGGEAPPKSRLAGRMAGFDLICAADSGLDTIAAWGQEPHIIVGDMDSISSRSLIDRYPKARVLIEPRDKDRTDTEIGLFALAEAGASRITLAGGGGGRLDHLLAIRALFERARHGAVPSRPRPAEWHCLREAVFLVEEGRSLAIDAEPGSIVSVFPLADGAEGMSSDGLKWSLEGLRWDPGDCGVSNVAPDGRFFVKTGKGDLLVALLFDSAQESLPQ